MFLQIMSESSSERERLEQEVVTNERVLEELSEAIEKINAEKKRRSDEITESEADQEAERTMDESQEVEEQTNGGNENGEETDESQVNGEETDGGDENRQGADGESENDQKASGEDETEQETDQEDEGSQASEGSVDVVDIRQQAEDLSEGVIGRPLDGVNGIHHDEDEWNAVIDVIERRSVPDTQDILGTYEIHMDDAGSVTGYRRLLRYRRGDRIAYDKVPIEWR